MPIEFERVIHDPEALTFRTQKEAQFEADRFNENKALNKGFCANAEKAKGCWGVAVFKEPGRFADFQYWLR